MVSSPTTLPRANCCSTCRGLLLGACILLGVVQLLPVLLQLSCVRRLVGWYLRLVPWFWRTKGWLVSTSLTRCGRMIGLRYTRRLNSRQLASRRESSLSSALRRLSSCAISISRCVRKEVLRPRLLSRLGSWRLLSGFLRRGLARFCVTG